MRKALVSPSAAVLADPALTGRPLREALSNAYDEWLAGLLGDPGPGVALVAVGGLGRREVSPSSDLDLLLVHDERWPGVAALADRVWYPVWDSGVGLDHSVRTVRQALAVAADDLKAALGLLDCRHVAGDAALSAQLLSAARDAWRRQAPRRLPELRAAGLARTHEHGELAFLLEPDLKSARGGLRDVHALQALAVAQVADAPPERVRSAARVLLDARGELHRRTGGRGRRTVDRLLLQEQDAVADALGYVSADELMAAVSGAARGIAHDSDTSWRRVLAALGRPPRRRLLGRRTPRAPERRPLADGVVEQDGEVVLARDAAPEHDPLLALRVALVAAQADLPVAPFTLTRLARCPALPAPWPAAARELFVSLLATGPPAVRVLEELDLAGLLEPLLPEWASVRSRPQRNSYHRYTVDRHLLEAASAAAALTRTVARPDLLLLGALLHDIGKGLPGDHTQTGMVVVARMAPRLGLAPADTQVLVAMVEHHLLLPDVATRRDLDDPATARSVADAAGSPQVLELLHALTRADSAATGPAAWSAWKAGLVETLVRRASALLAGEPPVPPAPLEPWQQALLAEGRFAVEARGDEVLLAAPDRPGLVGLATGVLALQRLDVRSAAVRTQGQLGVIVCRVSPRFGALPDWTLVRDDLRRALSGELDLAVSLAAREAAYPAPTGLPVAPPTVRLDDDASETATVLEVRAGDRLGVLHRITHALAVAGLDVRSAHISTLGTDVVDAFYVVGPGGGPLTDPVLREQARAGVLAALG